MVSFSKKGIKFWDFLLSLLIYFNYDDTPDRRIQTCRLAPTSVGGQILRFFPRNPPMPRLRRTWLVNNLSTKGVVVNALKFLF